MGCGNTWIGTANQSIGSLPTVSFVSHAENCVELWSVSRDSIPFYRYGIPGILSGFESRHRYQIVFSFSSSSKFQTPAQHLDPGKFAS